MGKFESSNNFTVEVGGVRCCFSISWNRNIQLDQSMELHFHIQPTLIISAK